MIPFAAWATATYLLFAWLRRARRPSLARGIIMFLFFPFLQYVVIGIAYGLQKEIVQRPTNKRTRA